MSHSKYSKYKHNKMNKSTIDKCNSLVLELYWTIAKDNKFADIGIKDPIVNPAKFYQQLNPVEDFLTPKEDEEYAKFIFILYTKLSNAVTSALKLPARNKTDCILYYSGLSNEQRIRLLWWVGHKI